MFIANDYFINEECMFLTGHYDRYGKLCTMISETSQAFFANQSPIEVLEDSIRNIGYDFKGALSTSRRLLEQDMLLPVMVNPVLEIVLFPIRSLKHDDNMWFNPSHIRRTQSHSLKTIVQLSNGKNIIVPRRLTSFNNRMQMAEQYKRMALEAAKSPRLYHLGLAKGRKNKNNEDEENKIDA